MAGARPPRVLVVDDEAAIRDIVRRYLTAEGFEVPEAADGTEALDRLRALQPDLVVLDVLMPGLDGLEVLRRLRPSSDVYLVVLTAKAEAVERRDRWETHDRLRAEILDQLREEGVTDPDQIRDQLRTRLHDAMEEHYGDMPGPQASVGRGDPGRVLRGRPDGTSARHGPMTG